jgi:hypothetical protein
LFFVVDLRWGLIALLDGEGGRGVRGGDAV